ncbi:hypothetical protein BCR39DRAFT_557132 [Naematelia encephala]|uniref:Uncharacterized protein n=1 Tax=Naematelia encephala TaxID=71784 RepID=A0A1Y2BG36_9TREE|nr:hypothetical protein BCR39DRAFT_557132 [Naematelia encephala]
MSAIFDLLHKFRPSGTQQVEQDMMNDETLVKSEVHSPAKEEPVTAVNDTSLPHSQPSSLSSKSRVSALIAAEAGGDHSSSPRINRKISFEMVETPSSTDRSLSNFSSPQEVYLGEQSIPFVFRRQQETKPDNAPSKLPEFFRHPTSSGRIAISPGPGQVDKIIEGKHINVDSKDGATVEKIASQIMGRPVSISQFHPCEWRKEQVKFCKRARIPVGATHKSITPLMGPLSLPYARNPSGVDAIIADKTEYLAHVWGLRAAPGVAPPHAEGISDEAPRTASNGSGITSTSSTTWNSSESNKMNTTSGTVNSGASTSSQQKVMVRDPYQSIGIRKGSSGKDEVIDKIREVEKIQKRIANAVQQSATEQRTTVSSRSDVSSEEQTGTTPVDRAPIASATALLRAQGSGTAHPLSPIPGSPVTDEGADAFTRLFENAISSVKLQSVSTSDLRVAHEIHTHQRGHSAPIDQKPTNSQASIAGRDSLRVSSTSHTIPIPPALKLTPQASSKADTSENWRTKNDHPLQHKPSAVVKPLSPISAAVLRGYEDDSMAGDVALDLLGLDDETSSDQWRITVKPPSVDPAILSMSNKSYSKGTAQNRTRVSQEGKLVRPTGHEDPAVEFFNPEPLQTAGRANTAKSLSAKGTPNAGKLLKKPLVTASAENAPEMPGRGSAVSAIVGKGNEKAGE